MVERAPAASRGNLHFAVVGAGIAGLACARALVDNGVRTTVFERGAQIGGRIASQAWEGGISDTGAQFLTARSESFAATLQAWSAAGWVQRWEPALAAFEHGQGSRMSSAVSCYVGMPTMHAIAERLGAGLDVVYRAQVGRITRGSAEWYLFDRDGRPLGISGFDGLVLAVPSPMALELVRGVDGLAAPLAPRLEPIAWDACWTTSVVFSRMGNIEFDVAFIRDDPILSWAAREGSKPGRELPAGVPERWLLQARPTWSKNFAHLTPDEAGRWMQRAFAARLARPMQQRSCIAVHWPYASPLGQFGAPCHWDASQTFGMAGDWCTGSSVESAYLSGTALAQAITASV